MSLKSYALISLMGVILLSGCTQRFYRKANIEYDRYAYDKAAVLYEKVLKKKQMDDAMIKLADSYRLQNRTEEAEIWYAQVVQLEGVEPVQKLHYAEVLKANGKCQEAKTWFGNYLKDKPADPRALNHIIDCDSLMRVSRDGFDYKVNLLTINTEQSSYSPVFYNKGIVFTSEREEGNKSKKNPWNGNRYLDLYDAQKGNDGAGEFATVEPLPGDVNGRFHEGPATFNEKGDVMYFTRSNMSKRKRVKDDNSINHLQLCRAEKVNDQWTNVTELPFNSDTFSMAHPTLSADGKTLYFISDMPGGQGGTDVYKSELKGEEWSAPVNLGPTINSAGNEMFPFINADEKGAQTLYYSSDGWAGLGGLDIYSSKLSGGKWGKIKHYPMPLNSSKDDFGVIVDQGIASGYFSSNRSNTTGTDMLYNLLITPRIFVMVAKVVDINTKEPLKNVTLVVEDENTGKKDDYSTNALGMVEAKVRYTEKLKLAAKADNYYAATRMIDMSTPDIIQNDTFYVQIELEPMVPDLPVVLQNIYYDFDKWNIRADAAVELDKVVTMLNENPEIKIELSSHTDCRHTFEYNEWLSQQRAESAVQYILGKKIGPDRITAKGYGERNLINECADGVPCPEAKHQENRRTEFKITGYMDKPVVSEPVDFGANPKDAERSGMNFVVAPTTEFKIELESGKNAPNVDKYESLQDLGDLKTEKAGDTQYLMLGSYSNRNFAEMTLSTVKLRGFEKAAIVLYKKGQRVE